MSVSVSSRCFFLSHRIATSHMRIFFVCSLVKWILGGNRQTKKILFCSGEKMLSDMEQLHNYQSYTPTTLSQLTRSAKVRSRSNTLSPQTNSSRVRLRRRMFSSDLTDGAHAPRRRTNVRSCRLNWSFSADAFLIALSYKYRLVLLYVHFDALVLLINSVTNPSSEYLHCARRSESFFHRRLSSTIKLWLSENISVCVSIILSGLISHHLAETHRGHSAFAVLSSCVFHVSLRQPSFVHINTIESQRSGCPSSRAAVSVWDEQTLTSLSVQSLNRS